MGEPRLTIRVYPCGPYDEPFAEVRLDDHVIYEEYVGHNLVEARAKAQEHVDSLLKHFREGGT